MPQTYRFAIRLVGYDDQRKKELKEFVLRNLHPDKGLDYFKALLISARTGDGQVIYQTNNPNDARRMAYTVATYGGEPAIDGDFEVDDV